MNKIFFNFFKFISIPFIQLGKALEEIFYPQEDKFPVNEELMSEHLISFTNAKAMYDEYIDKRYNVMKPILGDDFQDSKSSWFSIETLQSYINHLKTKDQLIDPSISGIRMYFGVYPEDSNSQKAQENGYLNHQNIFMVPTYFDEEGVETMFYLKRDSNNNTTVVTIPEPEPESNAMQISAKSATDHQNDGTEDLVLLNEGNLRPPPMSDEDNMD